MVNPKATNIKGGRIFTWEEIHAQNQDRKSGSAKEVWVVVKDVVYDVTDFVPKHPGGAYTIEMSAGQDITYLMETSHPFTKKPWTLLEGMKKLGTVNKPFVAFNQGDEPMWNEIKQKCKEYFESNKLDPKDPIPGLLTFAFLVLLWSCAYVGLCNGFYSAAIVFGVSRALFGIHTMHSSSHFAISRFPMVWKWLDWLCFDIFMGGSNLAWNYQHILGHHQYTNVFQADPDLPSVVEGDIRRIVSNQKWKALYKFQGFYLPVMYSLLALKTRVSDIMILLGDKASGPLRMTVSSSQYWLLVATKLFLCWYQLYVPVAYFGLSVTSMLKLSLVAELASGMWLAYFFQVNHISGDIQYTTAADATAKEWAAMQVEGTLDYAHDSALFTFLSGTLNFQTVHHLFPSISNHHYPALAKIIKPICKKYKVKYNYCDTFFGALWAHFKELHRMGQQGIPATVEHG